MARWVAIALVVVAVGWPAAVPAHRSVARELVVQLDGRGAVALWHVRVVGPKATLTVALWDHDRNGVLDDGERAGVAVSLLSGATGGVTLSWDGRPLRVSDLEPRLDSAGERSVAAMGLATLQLPSPTVGTHVLRIEVDEKSGPLAFQAQVLDFWQLTDTDMELAPDVRGLAQPIVVAPGQAVEIEVRCARNVGSSP